MGHEGAQERHVVTHMLKTYISAKASLFEQTCFTALTVPFWSSN